MVVHGFEIWDALRGDYEERAAIMEFDGGLSRDDAEQLAALFYAVGVDPDNQAELLTEK